MPTVNPPTKENVGPHFTARDLRAAQDRTREIVRAVAAKIAPGMTEKDGARLLKEALTAAGSEKIWHPPQIRFGANTMKPFAVPSDKTVVLQNDDIFFLDIGPVFGGYEGDMGETFVVGKNPEHRRIADDSKRVFNAVRERWQKTNESGADLYRFAIQEAEVLGWHLSLKGASGHRVSEFPHKVHYRGHLNTFDAHPSSDRWILEIHLFDPKGRFGAFYEDLL